MAQPAAEDIPDIVEVRCPGGGLHFKVVDSDTIEVKCRHCSDRDTVVLHRITFPTLEQKTLILKEPPRGRGARPPRKEVR